MTLRFFPLLRMVLNSFIWTKLMVWKNRRVGIIFSSLGLQIQSQKPPIVPVCVQLVITCRLATVRLDDPHCRFFPQILAIVLWQYLFYQNCATKPLTCWHLLNLQHFIWKIPLAAYRVTAKGLHQFFCLYLL